MFLQHLQEKNVRLKFVSLKGILDYGCFHGFRTFQIIFHDLKEEQQFTSNLWVVV
jgi:hypothetical protein